MSRHLVFRKPALIDRATTALTIVLLRSGGIAAKFGITLFIAHFLDLEALGLYGLVAGAAVVIPVVAALGMIEVLSRESVTQELGDVTAALVPYWAFMTALYVAVAAACLPWASIHDQVPRLLMISALLLIEHFNADILVVLNHRQQPRFANLLFTIRSAAWIGVYVGFALLFPQLRTFSALLAFWLLGTGAALLCFFWSCREWPWRAAFDVRRGKAKLWKLIRASRTIYFNHLANTGGQYADRYIVSVFLGLELAGVYFLFWSFANALSNLVNTSLLQVQQPAIILSRSETERQRRLLGRLRLEAVAVSLTLSALAASFAYLTFAFLANPTFSGQAHVLLVLLAGFVLRMAYEVEGIGLYSRHEDRNTLVSALIVFVVSLSMTAVLTPLFGLLGPALSVLTSYLVGVFLRWQRNQLVYRSGRFGTREMGC